MSLYGLLDFILALGYYSETKKSITKMLKCYHNVVTFFVLILDVCLFVCLVWFVV